MKIIVFVWWVGFLAQSVFALPVKVGVYQNPPKVFLDKEGKAQGFFVEVIKTIAKNEGWTLEYVPCEWDRCLEKVQRNEIDLFLDVAHSKERAEKFNFSREEVLSTWSNVYKRSPELIINSMMDFSHKKVGLLKGSIQEKKLSDFIEEKEISPLQVKFPSFDQMFEALQKGEVDLIIVNKFIGAQYESEIDLHKTHITFSPSLLYFISSPEKVSLLNRIDVNLIDLKNNVESEFYKAEKKWLYPHRKTSLPSWLVVVLMGSVSLIIVFIFINKRLKQIIEERSEELARAKTLSYMGIHTGEIVHTLKNALTPVVLYGESLKKKYPEDPRVEKIHLAAENLKDRVDLILKKNQHIQHHEDGADLNVDEFIKEEVEFNKILPQFEALDKIDLNLSSNAIIHMNPLDLQLILGNLMDNAIDSMVNSENKRLGITTRASESSLLLEVSDTGCGIPKGQLEKIFEPLYSTKGYSKESDQTGGIGLGLSSVKKYVEKYSGVIKVDSTVGEGTIFIITLPLLGKAD